MAEFTDIEKQLMERITESRLCDSLALIRNAVEDIWADDAPRIIQDYPDHGIHHSERLAHRAAQLLDANNNRSLSAEETYLLLAGIYLHDIGMQCDVVRHPEIKAKAEGLGAKFDVEFTAKTASSYTIDEQKAIRKNHHLLTGAWIDHARCTGETVLSRAIQTVPDDLVGDLIDVCKYHAKLPITECPTTFTLDKRGRKRLVAALVRFADELDIDGHRVSIETVKNFHLDPRNAVYWWLHNRTKVVIDSNVLTLTIRLSLDDMQRYGSLVREAFIEQFRIKNSPVISLLAHNSIPIVISNESGVKAVKYTDPLPDDIVRAFQSIREKKGVLDEPSERARMREAMPPQPSIISDKIDFYLVKEGNMHYIPDNPTLRYVEKSLGLRIHDYSSEKMRQLPFSLGDPLLPRAPGIVQDSQGIKYLIVVREEKRRILNDETLKALGGDPHTIFPTEDEYPASLQEGSSLPEEWGEQWFTSKPKLEEYVAAGYRARFLVCGQICRYISKPEWVKELRERLGIGSIEPIDRQKLESYVEGIPIDSERDVQTVLQQLCIGGGNEDLMRD